MSNTSYGTLFVVATPIGNLSEISPRMRETLARASMVAAEDTRRSGLLLLHLSLKKPLISLHKFNERARLDELMSVLERGEHLALITDGGTPAISDPGYRLVAAAHALGAPVRAVAGPSAVVAALSVSGLPADRFTFVGFLPSRASERRALLPDLVARPETLVIYEAPHRLANALADLAAQFGARPAVLCRELTKLHEEVRRATLPELAQDVAGRESVLGECVLVIAGAETAPERVAAVGDADLASLRAFALALQAEQGDPRRACARLARQSAQPRREITARLRALAAIGEDTES